jgi:parallel beta-helix repeat protein
MRLIAASFCSLPDQDKVKMMEKAGILEAKECRKLKGLAEWNCGRAFFTGLLSLLLITSLLMSFGVFSKVNSQTITVPGNFPTIQEAINNAMNGDTIQVNDGIYPEHLVVNKSIVLTGIGLDTIVDGSGSGTVVNITAANVQFSEFNVRNGTYGLYIFHTSSNNWIVSNKVTSNSIGILIDGSTGNTLSNNDMTTNGQNFGIAGTTLTDFVQDIKDTNTVNGKNVSYLIGRHDESVPSDAGYVAIVNSTGITAENLLPQNNCQGILVAYSAQIVVKDLKWQYPYANHRQSMLFINVNNSTVQNVTLSGAATDDAIKLISSQNNVVQNNTITGRYSAGTYVGISLDQSNDNTIADNTLQHGASNSLSESIDLTDSLNNTLSGNMIYKTTPLDTFVQGVVLNRSNGTSIFHNNFKGWSEAQFANQLVIYNSANNSFDNGYEGNYWSNYEEIYQANDSEGTGIWNTPYYLNAFDPYRDNRPLVEEWNSRRTFDVTWVYPGINVPRNIVTIFSDHVVANYTLAPNWTGNVGALTFNVTSGGSGYCTTAIPRDSLDGPFQLVINGTKRDQAEYGLTYDRLYAYLYFNYSDAGIYHVEIKGDRLGEVIGDVNRDGTVDIRDITIVVLNFKYR